MDEPQQSRRRLPRIAAEHVVMVSKSGPEELEAFAKMHSLGLGGCMFVSPEPLGEGTLVDLLLSIGARVVPVKARVVYELPQDGERREVGVEFLHVEPADVEYLKGFFPSEPEAS